jgi:ribosome-binding factor A
MARYRLERIGEIIKEVLSEIVLTEIKDPRVGLVTIVSVNVARDLSTAKVHFSVMGDAAQREQSMRILKGASGFMRHAIADAIDVQHAPELRWVYDDSLDRSFRIDEVLREANATTLSAAVDDVDDEEEEEEEDDEDGEDGDAEETGDEDEGGGDDKEESDDP